MNIVISVVIILVILTLLYKLMPFREMGKNKPGFALFPKYKTTISLSSSNNQNTDYITQKLAELGFKVTSSKDGVTSYSRGSIMGDLSVKIAKVNLTFSMSSNSEGILTVGAGWIAAFDTGDHWQLLSEIKDRVEI